MNIYLHELKYNLKSTLLWLFVLGGLIALLMCFFPAIKSDIKDFSRLLENYPPAIRELMGITTKSLSTSLGYYCFALTYVSLFAAIQASNLGVGIVSKEVRDKTADFLMTKPVSRQRILTAKLLSALTVFIVSNIFYLAESFAFVYGMSDNDFDMKKFALIALTIFYLQVIFFAFGFFVSILSKKIISVLPISLGLVLLFFAISAFAVTANDDKLRFLTPFQYFKAESIFTNGNYEVNLAVTGLILTVFCIAAGFFIYKRRDVHAV